MVKEENYYKVLDVNTFATTDEIKKAYRKLMLKYHPDVNPEPVKVEYFERVVAAYKVLSDTRKRNEYNRRHRMTKPFERQTRVHKETKVQEFKKEKKNGFFTLFSVNLFGRAKVNKDDDDVIRDMFKVSKELMNLDLDRLKEQFLKSTNKFVRAEALKAIVVRCEKQSYKIIEKALDDQSKEVKEVAVWAIGKLQIRQGMYYLADLFPKSGPNMRKAIVISMANLQFSKANEWLVHFCYDNNDGVRYEAVKAIYKNRLYSLLPQIKGLAYDKNPDVKELMEEMLKLNNFI